ncbi:TIR domain-containing protein [Corallococcus sp. CA054B]|uniref:TIR domain-containing protein n=1 Tax=Corallococcus sp. CA054B TaxID=2316734 RepID=UPI0013158558|nr:TIR domain-containing protein [Corallococcus sp. CA054B]
MPASGSSEIPVWLAGLRIPAAPRGRPVLDDADRNALVVVIDSELYRARVPAWRQLVEDFTAHPDFAAGRRAYIPVAATSGAHLLSPVPAVANTNAVPARDGSQQRDLGSIVQDIQVVLARMLTPSGMPELPTLFLSHAKADGEVVAQELREHLFKKTQLKTFFDRNDIPHASNFETSIEHVIANAFVVLIWTDRFADSQWCLQELGWALKYSRPILVIDAIREGAPRILPGFTNLPIIRWQGNPDTVIRAIVSEFLRGMSQQALIGSCVEALGMDASSVIARSLPPALQSELLTRLEVSTHASSETLHVYPDPPLPGEELALLARMGIRAITTTQLLAHGPAASNSRDDEPLKGVQVVFSTSNDEEDLEVCGQSTEHLDAVLSGMALHMFVLGASFATGGDFRSNGFVTRLIDSVRPYARENAVAERFESHIVWPIHKEWKMEDMEERELHVTLVLHPPPNSRAGPSVRMDSKIPPLEWALALTEMRRSLIKNATCLVAICGRRFGFRGRYPGVLEELALAIELKIPVYLVAGLGGVTRDVWDVISADDPAWSPDVFDLQQHIEKAEEYAELVKDLAHEPSLKPDFSGVRMLLRRLGLKGLSEINRLTEDENRQLASSRSPLEIHALIAKGISRLKVGRAEVMR